MVLTPAQNQIASDLHRFRVINCGRRFGKTTLAIEEIKGMALYKNSKIAYIAPTYQQAHDIAWAMLKKELQGVTTRIKDSPPHEMEIKNTKGGTSLLLIRGWESIETLRGQQFDFIILDEIASMRNFWLNWQEVIRPTLTDTKGQALFISTPKGFNHFYDLYNLESQDKDYKSFHFTSYDNPHIPREELDKARLELTEDRFAQEYQADFRKTEGLVYKEFVREKHLYSDDKQIIGANLYFAGLDFGHTNPAGLTFIKRDFDNHYWVTDEWYERGKTDAEIAEYVASCNFNQVYPDPENPGAIVELRKRAVNAREVVKTKDSVKHGINVVKELFKSGRLHINIKCKNLIYELETYSYPDKKDMRNDDENPIKENDHLLDSLRYALIMQGNNLTSAKVFYPKTSKKPYIQGNTSKVTTSYMPRK